MTILVTGGAGFIGANFVHEWFADYRTADEPIVNVDSLSIAGLHDNISSLEANSKHTFLKGDIRDSCLLAQVVDEYRPRAVLNFAAESHVDRSIDGPEMFIQTNVVGCFRLLEVLKDYWLTLSEHERKEFRFLHVSTDEVFGSLSQGERPFNEHSLYAPSSPYSATKASSDHLVRAWHRTYGLPTLITNCSNNYGPRQFPEKLMPMIVLRALSGRPLPLYGDGSHIRDWIYVSDHCSALRSVLSRGKVGESFCIGGGCEKTNLEVVESICSILDELKPDPHGPHARRITFVADRPGHDVRYALDSRKIETALDWRPSETFETGLRKTVEWYISNVDWLEWSLRDRHSFG